MRHKKKIIAWFATFGTLSAIILSPAYPMVIIVTGMLTGGILTLVFVASPTILLYSATLLPALLVWSQPTWRRWQMALALLCPFAVGLLPGAAALAETWMFEHRVTRADFTKPATGQPRTIELAGDSLSGLFNETAGDRFRLSCGEICRRLLFNREVERVRMTRMPTPNRFFREGPAVSATYRLEKRGACTESYPSDMIGKAVRDRLVAGECIASDSSDKEPMDAALALTTLNRWHYFPVTSGQAPHTVQIKLVRRLRIDQRPPDGRAAAQILERTETQSDLLGLPFHFGAEFHMQGGGYSGITIGRRSRTANAIDVSQILRDTFGFKVVSVEPLPPDDAEKIAIRILSLTAEAAPIFSAQQQEILNEALAPMKRKDELSGGDLDLVRRIIIDQRVVDGRIGLTLGDLFKKHTTQTTPMVPLTIERMKVPVPERVGHYQSTLGYSLMSFPAEALQPHREAIIGILEAQPDWPTAGLLARIGELDGDPSDLIKRRLEAKSSSVRQGAAVAICRSSPENWAKLKPIALAHLDLGRRPRHRVVEEDVGLVSALIRFGDKDDAVKFIETTEASDRRSLEFHISKLEKDFPASRCRSQ